MRARRIRRAVVALVALTALYGIAAEIGHGRLPTRLWMGSHYVDNVQLLPTFRSLGEEGAFLLESRILPDSVVASTRRVLLGLLVGSLAGILLGLATGLATRVEYLADPWVAFFRFTPALALLPLFVTWFGYGETSKVLLIAASVAVIQSSSAATKFLLIGSIKALDTNWLPR